MLTEFGSSLLIAEGPEVPFFGFPYPTRMAVIQLPGGGVWVWSPIALNAELISEVEALGPVEHIVSPNKIHHLFMKEWEEQWPDAKVYAPPGLKERKPELRFDADLRDEPDQAWSEEIDQVIFRGSMFMEEVVFFHRRSSTAIFCDLIQRHAHSKMTGWKGALMKIDGLVGERGSTPREWRASFLRRKPARAALAKVIDWQPQQLLIAHGQCAQSEATEIIEQALSWI